MSAGTQFRETKKAIAFRVLMTKLNATWEDLPAGSFAEAGTPPMVAKHIRSEAEASG